MTDIEWRQIFSPRLRDAEVELAAATPGDDIAHLQAVVDEYRAILLPE